MSDHSNNPKLFEIVKTYQVHAHSKICGLCHFWYGWYFSEKAIIAQPPDCQISSNERQEVLPWWNTLLRKVKSYINNDLHSSKVNMIDPNKDNFIQPITIKEILDELETFKDDYYTTLTNIKIWKFSAAFEKTTQFLLY